jgi:hypothetical protein
MPTDSTTIPASEILERIIDRHRANGELRWATAMVFDALKEAFNAGAENGDYYSEEADDIQQSKARSTVQVVPRGWKLVPVKPTSAMAAAAIGASMAEPRGINGSPQWRAIIAAAPVAQASAQPASLDKPDAWLKLSPAFDGSKFISSFWGSSRRPEHGINEDWRPVKFIAQPLQEPPHDNP